MPDQLQLRGGTTTEHNSFTGALREVTVDTTKKTLVVHDGSQAGGTPLMKESGATAASSVTLGTGGTERLKLTSSEVVFNETSTDTDFRIEGNGEANLFKVDAGNDRIGIGTSSPSNTFHIIGTGNDKGIDLTSTGAHALRFKIDSNASSADDTIFFQSARWNGTEVASIHMRAGADTTNKDDGRLTFHTATSGSSTTERMRIDSAGKVGIGTTAPSEALHVTGGHGAGVLAQSAGTTSGGLIRLQNTQGSTQEWYFGVGGGANNFVFGRGLMLRDVTGAATRLVVTTAGNVGINQINPRDKLEIKGDNGGYSFRVNAEAQFVKLLSSDNTGSTNGGFRFSVDNGATELERMRIDTSGHVGIGTSSPDLIGAGTNSTVLAVIETSGTRRGHLLLGDNQNVNQGGIGDIHFVGHYQNSGHKTMASIKALSNGSTSGQRGADLLFETKTDGTANPAERMRIHSTGELSLATTSKNLQGGGASDFYINVTANTGTNHNGMITNGLASAHSAFNTKPSANHQYYAAFYLNSAGSDVGNISCSNSATTFNTSSDYRLKENVVSLSDGITRLKQLLPKRFNWIVDETNTLQDGFLAHEVSSLVPEAVTGEKDAVATENGGQYAKGDPIYQTIDHSKLVPLLVAAVQELIGRVETLEAA